MNIENDEFDLNVLKNAVDCLPQINQQCTKQIILLCSRIADFKDSNKMNSYNLGIVFGPTVMRSRDPYIDFSNSDLHAKLFQCLIDNNSFFFSN